MHAHEVSKVLIKFIEIKSPEGKEEVDTKKVIIKIQSDKLE